VGGTREATIASALKVESVGPNLGSVPNATCPYCVAELPSRLARQCFACGTDWHDQCDVLRQAPPAAHRRPRPRRRPAAPPFLLLVLCCGLAQVLLVALVVLLIQLPGLLAPAIVCGVPIVALLVHVDDGSPVTAARHWRRWLQRGVFLLVSLAALAAPTVLPWIAGAALLAAAGYWTWMFLGPPLRRGRSALAAWLVLFGATLAGLAWLGAGPATVAAVILAFCFAETINLLIALSQIVRRLQRFKRS